MTTWEDTMMEVTIRPLLGKLHQLAVDEVRALGSVSDDIRSVRDKLMWMQAFLRDADPRRRVHADELARVWIKQTRDAAFDAEDAVDQYDLRVDLSRFTTQVRLRQKLYRRIKSINARLDDIAANKSRFGTEERERMQFTPTEPALTWRASTTISAAANTRL